MKILPNKCFIIHSWIEIFRTLEGDGKYYECAKVYCKEEDFNWVVGSAYDFGWKLCDGKVR